MTVINNLEMNFDPDAILELKVSDGSDWVEVTPDIFRSWGGERRINGKEFCAPIYYMGTNNINEIYKI